ncbi:hypothetical protein A3K34_02585 [candidate division WWE3 bacterium RIFOXYC1_FULL_40_10]|uniref:O-antigen ligase-related domain-containing protein n=1 Tax=candidate division WWE3 bacterium RIFOXYA2_FULL_46_9 TaxID=1802636 RepID=A0A1F4W362_UNCKA|nr:MAG: hypothetical protein A3K58_02585 [candidate division WWE3 bacterium RIFOXYB1_FULL_40_22]OGC61734.1 MAG: hypothetical protein A3K37_02585 [candidate division WWE3 bacterium RIFOXYA1_FULL_40_11]OGC63718.1 MAG: hypothetical protein A2264_05075 [candidate division WWE3 bacterium RIFOXYA2_FULL_46_9]OGC65125.1 MAG: hypothetical protein A2326_01010 [candidate division WWE3 bacterium RIFOXYB2_FULL_41_6]OGC66117.1 MAG: hypothetical protein A3K34_02585 [candidate division WWE3 bacterium RIFOXYC1_
MLKYLFYLCVLSLSLGQLSVIAKSGGFSIYLFDISIAVFAFFGCIYFLLAKKRFAIPSNSVFFLIFSGFVLVSNILTAGKFNSSQHLVANFYYVRWLVYLIAAVVVYNMLKMGLISMGQIIQTFLLSGYFIFVAGLIQLVILPDFGVLDPSLGWDPHKNRLSSTFFDPNFTGAYLSMCTILALSQKRVLSLLVLVIGIILTFSRSSWLTLSVILVVYGATKNPKIIILALIGSFLAYFAVPRIQTRISGITDPADSAHFRIISWNNAVSIWKHSPIFGVGFNYYRYVQEDFGFLTPDDFGDHAGAGSDSSFLNILATSGIVGLVFYLLGFFSPFLKGMEKEIVSSLAVNSMFINSLFFPAIMFFWLIFLFSAKFRDSHT